MIDIVKQFYITERIEQIDQDFLRFEEDMITQIDLKRILSLLRLDNPPKLTNEHNSILLYLTGLTDDFDFQLERSDTIDGSPPDVDIDFDSLQRMKAIELVQNKWGPDKTAYIITHGTLKPKSLVRRYHKVMDRPPEELHEILDKIPEAKFGKEPKFKEVLEAAPELLTNPKYKDFVNTATKLENLTSNFGVHAAGLVISSFPIYEVIPMWMKTESFDRDGGVVKKVEKWVTQYDMKEAEELGLIKYDFLGIENLSILRVCAEYIKKYKDTEFTEQDVYSIPDGDAKTYDLLASGLLTGVFQMETSGSAKKLITTIKPQSIEELSDISALNRPGPMTAGLDTQYAENKNNGYPPEDMPEQLATLLSKTYWTLVYQEQLMELVRTLAGFTLKEADDIRRVVGKKKKEELAKWEPELKRRLHEVGGLSPDYIDKLWSDILGYADYALTTYH